MTRLSKRFILVKYAGDFFFFFNNNKVSINSLNSNYCTGT